MTGAVGLPLPPAPRRSTALQATGVLVALAVLTACTLFSLTRASQLRTQWPPEADNFYLPSSSSMRLLSLGHHELAADLVAARGNVYFGTQIFGKGEQRWLSNYLNTAIDLDPYFHRLYLAGAAMIVYNGKTITTDSMLAATELLERGARAFPLDWEIKFQLGFNYLFELSKLTSADDPRVARWRQRGVEEMRQAALFEDVPPWLPNLVARVFTKSGGQELAIRHLEQAYATASSEEARYQIRAELIQLRGQQYLHQLEEERLQFEEIVKRYPYAPDAFSAIAGPRKDRSVELPTSAPPIATPESKP